MRVEITEMAAGIRKLKNPSPFCTSTRRFLCKGTFLSAKVLKALLYGASFIFTWFFKGIFPFRTFKQHSHKALTRLLGHFRKRDALFLLFESNFKCSRCSSTKSDILSPNESGRLDKLYLYFFWFVKYEFSDVESNYLFDWKWIYNRSMKMFCFHVLLLDDEPRVGDD